MAGQGQRLDENTRTQMETSFGADFSDVRIHTDASSPSTARTVGARAYTHGNHIAFAPGQYQPDSSHGRRLLAHELAHVVQQSQGRARPNIVTESERELAAHRAADGQPASIRQ